MRIWIGAPLTSSEWCRAQRTWAFHPLVTGDEQSCSTPHSHLEHEVTNPSSLATSRWSVISHHPVQIHTINVYIGATFVKRFANYLEVSMSVGRSAPTDQDQFLMFCFAVAVSQQRWIYARCPFWRMADNFDQYCLVLCVGTTLVSVML